MLSTLMRISDLGKLCLGQTRIARGREAIGAACPSSHAVLEDLRNQLVVTDEWLAGRLCSLPHAHATCQRAAHWACSPALQGARRGHRGGAEPAGARGWARSGIACGRPAELVYGLCTPPAGRAAQRRQFASRQAAGSQEHGSAPRSQEQG